MRSIRSASIPKDALDQGPSGTRHGPTKAEKSVRYLVWIGIFFACAAFATLTALVTLQARERAIDAAKASVQNVALLLDQHTKRTVETVDLLLRTVLYRETRRTAQGDRGPGIFSLFVEQMAKEQAHVAALMVLDGGTGRELSSIGEPSDAAGSINAEAYSAFRADPGQRIHVGQPIYDASSKTWLIGISGSSAPSPGERGLIAVAHIDLAQIQALYEDIDLGKQGGIVLWRSDGVLLVRKPYDTAHVGRKFPNTFFIEALKQSSTGTSEIVSATDGIRRIVAYRQLQALPLVITAALVKDEILATWWKDALTNLALIPVILLIVLAFGALIGREARKRDQAENRLRDNSELLEATLDNMDQGLMMMDGNQTVQIYNRRFLELLDLPPELLAEGPSLSDVVRYQTERGEFANAGADFHEQAAQRTLAQTFHAYERQRPDGTVLEIRTVPIANGGAVRTYTDITARKEAEERITHMARHDALTDLPNRLLFRERLDQALSQAMRRSESLALLCLDLDQFKAVNDTLGHPVGDALLEEVADRIRGGVREEDTVARLGGDEFAVLQISPERPDDSVSLAERLVELMNKPFHIAGQALTVSVSIGIALAPGDGKDPDELFKNADLALYRAKAEGRATFRLFEPEMDAHVRARRALEMDLREALAKGEFEIYYQPFLDLVHHKIVGFEALLRWNHPSRGQVSPSEFIPIAEETGLILALGEWVLRQACKEAAISLPGCTLAVNISAAQFRSANLVQTVVSALSASGLPADRLELEITETSLMQNSELSARILHQLRSIGVRIAMDDFGTGYSSLSYLHSFPFDKIKIDRSFVRQMIDNAECAAIVRTIVRLGQSLGMATIAEGVETREQLEALRAEGCMEVQGYLVSTPKPLSEAAKLLPPPQAIVAA